MLQTLLRMLPSARGSLAVKLIGVDGFTGRGSIRFSAAENGGALSVSLTGVAGLRADIVADGEIVATAPITNGRAEATFSSSKGDILPALQEGAQIDIQQNGDVVLTGILART